MKEQGNSVANPGRAEKGREAAPHRTFRGAAGLVALLAGLTLAGCGGARYPQPDAAAMLAGPDEVGRGAVTPRIVSGSRRLQCVPYARWRSKIAIRGDAWTWWRRASGTYRRGAQPAVGAVLVLKRKASGGRGHLAVVTRILSDREIVVDHANWLNRGKIHKDTVVRDVSARNDWSAVRVWYTPGHQYGLTVYHPYGFIYPMPHEQRADAR